MLNYEPSVKMNANRNEMSSAGKTDFIPAFHPKARWCIECNWQVFWLVLCWMPSHTGSPAQWRRYSTTVYPDGIL